MDGGNLPPRDRRCGAKADNPQPIADSLAAAILYTMLNFIVLAALGGALPTEMPAVIVHEPTRVDSATERSTARCRNLEIVVERPLTSEASGIANMASIAVNGRSLGDPTLRPFLTFLSDLDSLYQLTFTCGHNGVIGIYASRARGSRSGAPSYSRARAWFSEAGLVQFNPPEEETSEKFWLR